MIIWLDLPWRVTAWRIVFRHVKLTLKGTNKHPGWRRLWSFLKMQRAYHLNRRAAPRTLDDDGATTRLATAQALQPYAPKLHHCTTTYDVVYLLKTWGQ